MRCIAVAFLLRCIFAKSFAGVVSYNCQMAFSKVFNPFRHSYGLSGVNISFTPNAGHEITGSPCISISMPLKLHCSCLDGKRPMSESAYSLNNSARDKNPTEDTENGTVSSIHSAIESAPAYIKWHGNFCVRVVIVGWIRSAPFDFVSLPA